MACPCPSCRQVDIWRGGQPIFAWNVGAKACMLCAGALCWLPCRNFFSASQGPAWELVLKDSGHFQFLDSQSLLQRAVCAVGPIDDGAVRGIAQVQHSLYIILLSFYTDCVSRSCPVSIVCEGAPVRPPAWGNCCPGRHKSPWILLPCAFSCEKEQRS